ncbi:hypothetical protein ACPZ19_10600 [Amycolatopsis lurida]
MTMPFPIEFAIPPGWRAPQPHEAESPVGAVAAVRPEQDAVIAASGEFRPDSARLPGIADESIARVLLVNDSAEASAPEIVQCQAFLAIVDVDSVRPPAGDEKPGDRPPVSGEHPVPRHTRSALPGEDS